MKSGLKHIPGLDGIRAIAILVIVLFHYWPFGIGYFPGGFIGVDIFFTVSGFLITTLLVNEWKNSNAINLKHFWIRRTRRLIPALVFFVIVLVIAITTIPTLKTIALDNKMDYIAKFFPDTEGELAALKPQIMAMAIYASNWYLILKNGSYFETTDRPPLLEHLWSLAIEEQFYIFWPIFISLCLSFSRSRKTLPLIMFAAGLLSYGLMLALGKQAPLDARAYFGTDTRAFSLIIGCLLAYFYHENKKRNLRLFNCSSVTDLLGIASLLLVVFLTLHLKGGEENIFSWGLLISSIAGALLIISAVNEKSIMSKYILGNQFFVWLGKRSYGIYIWHWPIFVLTEPSYNYEISGTNLLLLRTIVLLGISEFSYRFIENPIRHGAIKKFITTIKTAKGEIRNKLLWKTCLSSMVLVVTIAFCCISVSLAKPKSIPGLENIALENNLPSQEIQSEIAEPENDSVLISSIRANEIIRVEEHDLNGLLSELMFYPVLENFDSASFGTTIEIYSKDVKGEKSKNKNRDKIKNSKNKIYRNFCSANEIIFVEKPVTAIGDSVMLGAKIALEETFVNIRVNAQVSRQFSEACNIATQLKESGQLSPYVLLHLGTNGTIFEKDLSRLLEILRNCEKIVVMNIRAPRSWQNSNNSILERVTAEYPNVRLLNWHEASTSRHEVFYKDGIHLNHPGGACYYARLAISTFK